VTNPAADLAESRRAVCANRQDDVERRQQEDSSRGERMGIVSKRSLDTGNAKHVMRLSTRQDRRHIYKSWSAHASKTCIQNETQVAAVGRFHVLHFQSFQNGLLSLRLKEAVLSSNCSSGNSNVLVTFS